MYHYHTIPLTTTEVWLCGLTVQPNFVSTLFWSCVLLTPWKVSTTRVGTFPVCSTGWTKEEDGSNFVSQSDIVFARIYNSFPFLTITINRDSPNLNNARKLYSIVRTGKLYTKNCRIVPFLEYKLRSDILLNNRLNYLNNVLRYIFEKLVRFRIEFNKLTELYWYGFCLFWKMIPDKVSKTE